jgi:capsular exopolysaccharide synthesis family protein
MTTEFSTELAGLVPPGQIPAQRERALSVKRLIRLRGPLMAAVALILLVPSVTAVWLVVPPQYRAVAVLRFLAKTPAVLEEDSRAYQQPKQYEQFVSTELGLITGPAVLDKVVQKVDIETLPLVASSADLLQLLQAGLTANRSGDSELVYVSFSSENRQTAVTIVETVLDEYTNMAFGRTSTMDDRMVGARLEEAKRLESELERLRERINIRRRETGSGMFEGAEGINNETQYYHENLSTARAELVQTQSRIQQLSSFLSNVEDLAQRNQAEPDKPIYEHGIEDLVAVSISVQTLEQMVAAQEAELAGAEEKFRDDAAPLAAIRLQRDSTETHLKEAKREARSEALNSVLERYRLEMQNAEEEASGATNRLTEFEKKLEESKRRAVVLSEALADIGVMEKSAEDLDTKLKRLEDRIYRERVERGAPADIEITSAANAPQEPDINKRLKFVAAAILASIMAGLSAGIWREFTDQQVRSAQDISYVTDLSILATIPHASLDRLPASSSPSSVTAEHPGSTSADEYRRVLTRIIYPPEGSAELNTVLIVGPSRGDGKTTAACNIAISLARANRRVLLVDVGARRPDTEHRLGLPPGPGISDIFSGDSTPDEVLRPTSYDNLFVLGPGLNPDQIFGKLASREMVQLLEYAEDGFEHVIIDTPPALLMSDAKLLAPIVDGVVVVVGAEVSSIGMVQRCLNDLRQVSANVVGLVLNRVKSTRGGYLRTNMDLFYAYSDEEGAGKHKSPPRPGRRSSPLPEPMDATDEASEPEDVTIMLLDEDDD